MSYSVVERDAFRPRDDDDCCPLYDNGRGPFKGHCRDCDERLYRIIRARDHNGYRVRDGDGRIITAGWVSS